MLSVHQPIKDFKGKMLLDVNLDVLDWSKRAILNDEYSKKKTKFKDVPQLLEDLQQIFETPPYNTALEGWASNLREWIGESWAPSVIFDELKYQRARDPYGYKHVLTIAVMGSRLLELWIKAAPTLKKAFQAFLMHDIGKSRVTNQILLKEGSLDEIERRSILEHPITSYVLNSVYWGDSNHLCAEVALHHHEDRLGKGYPQGIKTTSLILDILATLDRFDALITDRPFRYKKFSPREAFDLLKKDVEDGRIEGDVLRALVALVRKEKITELKKIKLGTIGRASLKKN